MNLKTSKFVFAVVFALPFTATANSGVTSSAGEQLHSSQARVDYRNAQPLPLPSIPGNAPLIPTFSSGRAEGTPGDVAGGNGSGKEGHQKILIDPDERENTPPPKQTPSSATSRIPKTSDDIVSQAFGTSKHPFTTTRVDYGGKLSKKQPYRRSGKLFFDIGSSTFICSASLVKPGIVVTAAHCVADFGNSSFYSNWEYVPGYKDGVGPWGTWTTTDAYVVTSYLDGTDPCAFSGIVCENDVAVLVLDSQLDDTGSPYYVGESTGWYGYSWNGYGFNGVGLADGNKALFTQLGYPANHDSAEKMQRTDSQAFTDSSQSFNSIWGSRQGGGSSGGPELVNFGKKAVLSGTTFGAESKANRVVGVTSWGFVNPDIKQQGASPFTSGNIEALVNDACAAYPDRC